MRSPSSPVFWPRRALAVTGLVSIGAGLLMFTAAAHPAGAAASTQSPAKPGAPAAGANAAAHKPSKAAMKAFEAGIKHDAHAAAAGNGARTFTGPHMFDPATGKPFPDASTVTVSQTTSLVNQMLQVTWTNFTPSSTVTYTANSTFYPVMVTECKGQDPASPADCYGATNAGVTSTSGTSGPMNDFYATTAANGTGEAEIQIFASKAENSFLRCDSSAGCSLAIVPAQGGNFYKTPTDCADHSSDTLGFGAGTAVGTFDFGSVAARYQCSWDQKIVVPLKFAPSASNCPFQNSVFAADGSPMLGRAMNSWVAKLCAGSHGFTVNYDTTIPEPTALQDLVGQTDVALTTRSANAQSISTGTKKYKYAPIAVSAVSVAYWFDDPATGLPQSGVELNQRLLAKLLTQSYAYENDACQPGVPNPPPPGCDNGVEGDALNLFADGEFQQLNPSITEPVSGPIEVPTVVSGQSDMTWVTTNWIVANKDANSFLGGTFDPWDEHVNTYYLGLTDPSNGGKWPNNSFIGQDPYPVMQHQFTPVFPLTQVATDQVENWPPATSWQKDQFGNFDRLPAEIPGQRALIAVVDQADAAAFRFPVAKLANGAGKYETPSTSHMLAALQGLTGGGQGTKLVNPNGKDAKAYPLTMVIYAAVPISGVSHTKAVAISKFLDFAVGPGQTPGTQVGQLPPGYAPLPSSMRAQTRKIANEVLHQTGDSPTSKNGNPSSNPGGGNSPSPNSSPSPGGSVSLPTPGASNGPPVAIVPVAHVQPASITRYILPALLILGGLAALAGSSSLVGSSSEAITAQLRRLSQQSVAAGKAARRHLGFRRSK